MNTATQVSPARPQRSLSWLPPVITIPVAALAGLYAFAQGINSALTDGPPIFRHQDWIFVSLVAQVVFGLSAIALVVIGRLTTRQRAVTVIGSLVLAASIITPFACTQLAGPV